MKKKDAIQFAEDSVSSIKWVDGTWQFAGPVENGIKIYKDSSHASLNKRRSLVMLNMARKLLGKDELESFDGPWRSRV